jgi:hypothetical protein
MLFSKKGFSLLYVLRFCHTKLEQNCYIDLCQRIYRNGVPGFCNFMRSRNPEIGVYILPPLSFLCLCLSSTQTNIFVQKERSLPHMFVAEALSKSKIRNSDVYCEKS